MIRQQNTQINFWGALTNKKNKTVATSTHNHKREHIYKQDIKSYKNIHLSSFNCEEGGGGTFKWQ